MPNYWFKSETVSMELGGRQLTIETGRLAKQAHGACVVSYGETTVLATVTHGKPRAGIDNAPGPPITLSMKKISRVARRGDRIGRPLTVIPSATA